LICCGNTDTACYLYSNRVQKHAEIVDFSPFSVESFFSPH